MTRRVCSWRVPFPSPPPQRGRTEGLAPGLRSTAFVPPPHPRSATAAPSPADEKAKRVAYDQITAFVKGTGGFEVAIVKRGTQWKIGIASLGRVLEPGNVKRTDGKSACAAM